MQTIDLSYITIWWLMFFIIGTIFLPLTFLIFSSFFDKGYIFSKILGILFISYAIWLLASLKIVNFSTINIFAITAIFAILNFFISRKYKLLINLKPYWKIFLFEEIMFAVGLFFWAYIKAHEPSIHALEKFMDFGFINSILRSDFFPPKDIWMSQKTINYYYFGHLVTAVLTKLSLINPAIAFNLMLSSLFGLTLSSSFSIGSNIYSHFTKNYKSIILAGILAAFLVTLSGNLHTIYAFFESYKVDNPIPFWQLQPKINFKNYWYPNATRFIPFTIHEFPLYSFVVSDLHGHVLSIPIVFLIIILLVNIFYKTGVSLFYYPFLGFLLAVATMTNALDGPIYLFLSILVLLFKKSRQSLIHLLIIISSAVIFSLPFWVSFKSFSPGIGVLCAPQILVNLGKLGPFLFEVNHCQRSPFWMLFIVYGFFFIVFLGYLFILRLPSKKGFDKNESLMLIFMLFAVITILIPELIYVKDIYPAHYRANTVFKFGYQDFIVSSLSASFMILRIRAFRKNPVVKYIYLPLLSVALFLISIFPFFAINSYFNGLKNYSGLNGLNYLKELYPQDFQGILWINQNIKHQPVILEAEGESYTDFARVSANTGLPTIIGWPVHEWLWRNNVDEVNIRKGEVDTLYESPDIYLTKNLIKKYHIEYVFIGTLERQKYPLLNEDKFKNLGHQVYRNDETLIYQLTAGE